MPASLEIFDGSQGYGEFEVLVRIMSGWRFDGTTPGWFTEPAHRIVAEYLLDHIRLRGQPPHHALLLVIAQTDATLALADERLRAEVVGVIEQIGFRLQPPGGEGCQ